MIASDRYSSKPDVSTALPKTFPPPTRIKVCHDSELKSTSVKIPDPNINATKHREIIEISPNASFVHDEVAKRQIVNSDERITATFLRPNTFPRSYTTNGMLSMSLGLMIMIMRIQERNVHSKLNGSATAIHRPNEIGIPAYN